MAIESEYSAGVNTLTGSGNKKGGQVKETGNGSGLLLTHVSVKSETSVKY